MPVRAGPLSKQIILDTNEKGGKIQKDILGQELEPRKEGKLRIEEP